MSILLKPLAPKVLALVVRLRFESWHIPNGKVLADRMATALSIGLRQKKKYKRR
jgi:hypothetical protein